MDYLKIEEKWNKIWEDTNIYKFDRNNLDKKFYLLEMFSYPSGASLHLGHWWNFGLSDSFGRYKRLQGYNVFQPMGFDAFGLPAENYAIKTGIHPEDSTRHNIALMEQQLKKIGGTFNWDYELITCNPDYYRWTQWLFIQLYKKGLAYQKEAPVNYCPSCNTIIANEQVVDGHCERCGSEVIRKSMKQWFFKITAYAEELLSGLDKIDWPEKTKALQRNWIGKSIGAEVDFELENGKGKLTVFTSRADTLFGVTFLVIAPEHKLVKSLVTKENEENVEKYIKESLKKDEITRTSTALEKTGVFTGSYVINPLTGDKVPVFVADYVISTYATGIVMGVACHDERDFDFAKKYNLKTKQVLEPKDGSKVDMPFCEYGKLVNSDEFTGLTSEEAKVKIVEKLEKIGKGRFKTNYKLRDWSVARQRYWGCPIPIIHCEKCGAVPVNENELPVLLPHITDYKPEGEGPLGKCEEYMHTTCPKCGRPALREPDTLDTFVCSSFYQLRYPESLHNNNEIFNRDYVNKMLPVDCYVGGVEHATGHLLYSRFITKFLRDIGALDFDEPFQRLFHQGMILGPDGKKMSKRNTARTADDYVNTYGSDALRLHMMFSLKYQDGGIWDDGGIVHMKEFMERIERIVLKFAQKTGDGEYGDDEKALDRVRHMAIKEVANGYETFSFNTAVAEYMKLVNAMYKYDQNAKNFNAKFARSVAKDLIILIAPATPHFAEELWQEIGEEYSVFNQHYPTLDESKTVLDDVEIAVQVNSKIISRIVVPTSAQNDELLKVAKEDEKVKEAITGKAIIKEIVVPKRLINLIVK